MTSVTGRGRLLTGVMVSFEVGFSANPGRTPTEQPHRRNPCRYSACWAGLSVEPSGMLRSVVLISTG